MTPGRLGSVRPKEFIRKLARAGFRVDYLKQAALTPDEFRDL